MFARLELTLVCAHLEVTVLMVRIVPALLELITRDFESYPFSLKVEKPLL